MNDQEFLANLDYVDRFCILFYYIVTFNFFFHTYKIFTCSICICFHQINWLFLIGFYFYYSHLLNSYMFMLLNKQILSWIFHLIHLSLSQWIFCFFLLVTAYLTYNLKYQTFSQHFLQCLHKYLVFTWTMKLFVSTWHNFAFSSNFGFTLS